MSAFGKYDRSIPGLKWTFTSIYNNIAIKIICTLCNVHIVFVKEGKSHNTTDGGHSC
jgi:hypothetical protein